MGILKRVCVGAALLSSVVAGQVMAGVAACPLASDFKGLTLVAKESTNGIKDWVKAEQTGAGHYAMYTVRSSFKHPDVTVESMMSGAVGHPLKCNSPMTRLATVCAYTGPHLSDQVNCNGVGRASIPPGAALAIVY